MFKIHERVAEHLQAASSCNSPWSYPLEIIVIVVCCLLGIAWAIYNIFKVEQINVRGGYNGDITTNPKALTSHQESLLIELGHKISEGAKEFLKAEYAICFIFIAVMFIIITFLTEQGLWTAFAFLIGAVVSVICGIIGMVIATRTNYRVTYCAYGSLAAAFRTAYRAGCVMGFALVSLGLLSTIYTTQFSPFSSYSTSVSGVSMTETAARSTLSHSLNLLPDLVSEDPSLPSSEEWEEVFTPRPPMWAQILWEKWSRASPKTAPRTPLLLLTMWATMWAMWLACLLISSAPSQSPPAPLWSSPAIPWWAADLATTS